MVAARDLAERVLEPAAAEVDAGQVPRAHLDLLAGAGLLGIVAPRSAGGAQAPPGVVRRVTELLAGADLATWFVQAQHHGPVRALAEAGGFDTTLAELAAGRRIAGTAFSHLRRWPATPVVATRDGDGWRLDGVAPWYTGWGLSDFALLAGAGADGEVVSVLAPARRSAELQPSEPLPMAALQAARTVTLRLKGLRVPGEAVVSVRQWDDWAVVDRRATVNVNPAVFGVAGSTLRLLAEQGRRRGEAEPGQVAERLAARLTEVRAEAYHLIDDSPPDERTERRLQLRAQALRLLIDTTTCLVVAGAGGSLASGAAAARKAREATFLLVQAQTALARRTTLQHWSP